MYKTPREAKAVLSHPLCRVTVCETYGTVCP